MDSPSALASQDQSSTGLLSFHCPITGIIFGQLAAFGSSELQLPMLPLAHCLSIELLRSKMLLKSSKELTEGLTQSELAGILQAELLLTFPPSFPVYSPTGLNKLLSILPKPLLVEKAKELKGLRMPEKKKLRSQLPEGLHISKSWIVEGLNGIKKDVSIVAERLIGWLDTLMQPVVGISEGEEGYSFGTGKGAEGRSKGILPTVATSSGLNSDLSTFSLDLSVLSSTSEASKPSNTSTKLFPENSLKPLSSRQLCLRIQDEKKKLKPQPSPLLEQILVYWKEAALAPSELCLEDGPKKIEKHLVVCGFSPELAMNVRKKLLENQWDRENASPFAAQAFSTTDPLALVQMAIAAKLKQKVKVK